MCVGLGAPRELLVDRRSDGRVLKRQHNEPDPR
jgi:hypothetical protein